MLSFGYTLLVQEAIAALETAGLDAAVGFMHQARWGRPCLALDLRRGVPAADRGCRGAAVRHVRGCPVRGVHGHAGQGVPDGGPGAGQAFLAAYERRMLTLFTHDAGRRVSYRVGLGLQAKALARAVLDPAREYRPVRWK
jgi:CRISP-associated protein Cas1